MPTDQLRHITESYRNDDCSRLVRVEAYFRNDRLGGVGVTLGEGADFSLFDEMMGDYEDAWRQADASERKETATVYLRQLAYWGTVPTSERTPRDSFLSALNIAFLERKGTIESDRYNGCRFTYEVDPERLDDLMDDVVERVEQPGRHPGE